MLEPILRPTFHWLVIDKILSVKVLSQHLSPNICTLLAAIIGGLVILPLWYHQPVWALILLLASGFLDVFDGALARFQNRSSAIGTVLDILSDRFVEFCVVFGLFLQAPQQRGIFCLLMLGAILLCVTSFLVVGIFSENNTNKSFYYSPGLIERFEAFLFFATMILLPAYFTPLAIIFSFLVLLTTIIRVIEFSNQSNTL